MDNFTVTEFFFKNDIVYNNPSFEIDTIDNLLDIIYEKYPDKKTYLTHTEGSDEYLIKFTNDDKHLFYLKKIN